MKHYVYQYLDPLNFTPFYIGKGTGNRKYTHINKARKQIKKSYPVIDKCKKLLEQGYEPIIEIIEYFQTHDEAFLYETAKIKEIGRKDLGNGPLLNLTDGGEGCVGRTWSAERREKWSGKNNPMFGKIPWKEAGKENPMKGKKHSEESRLKMSKKVKESYTAEHKLRRSQRSAGQNNPMYGKPAVNRRPVTFRGIRFDSIKKACNHFNVRKGTVYKDGTFD